MARQVDTELPQPLCQIEAEYEASDMMIFKFSCKKEKQKGFALSFVLKWNWDMVYWYPQKIGIN